ncbi:MAG TPA: acyl-CoA dehydrogenase family protein [Streptosporangiaceae bacterium]|nr:acyl-CoA dehydrogenase family protein [Streptosporangiaceae bacterium]
MNLDPDPRAEEFRAEVRAWLDTNLPDPPLPSVNTAAGFAAHRDWERKLAGARLAAVSWPRRYGGRDAPLAQWLVFEEEYYRAGGPVRVGQNGLFLLAPTLFAHGTDEQRDAILPPMATAEQVWAQAWSEPGAGSDLAAIRSAAVRTDGGWLLRGQKTWSSRAAFADRAFGLFRSEPGAERHRGLTYLMFDLRAPGVTVRPIAQLDGEPGFAEIFLDDVFVPDTDVIGAPGDGWRVAMSTASHERGLSLRSPGRFLAAADRLFRLWQRTAAASGSHSGSALGERVADAWIGARAYQLHTFGTVAVLADGGTLGAESSLGKVFWSQLDVSICETALDLLGPRAEVLGRPVPDGDWAGSYLFSLAGPIYAGTNEIQRSVIAERLLGLPR